MNPTHVLLFLTNHRDVEALLVGTFEELAALYRARSKELGGFLLLDPNPDQTNITLVGCDGVKLVPLTNGWWDCVNAGREKLIGNLENRS